MDQPGVEVRPLRQMTGTAEFNEVFFTDARADAANVLGPVGEGWKVAMATLGFERGTAFLSQQLGFQRELAELIELARSNGAAAEPVVRQELADSYVGVQIMKYNGMRMLTSLVQRGELGPEASIGKLYWSTWHRTLGERAMHVLGADGALLPTRMRKARRGRRVYLERAPADLPVQPVGDDLRRRERDPAQHHR